MRNIGKAIEKQLTSVGICSAEALKKIGSKEAFLRLKTRCSNVCLVHLYTLQGAIDDVEYNQLSEETKRDLKKFNDGLK
jgi:DNA transformation protein